MAPEGLFRERGLIVLVVGLALALAALSGLDFPALDELSSPHYIEAFAP